MTTFTLTGALTRDVLNVMQRIHRHSRGVDVVSITAKNRRVRLGTGTVDESLIVSLPTASRAAASLAVRVDHLRTVKFDVPNLTIDNDVVSLSEADRSYLLPQVEHPIAMAPFVVPDDAVQLDRAALAENIAVCVPAASNDPARDVICHVLLCDDGAVATDSYSLVRSHARSGASTMVRASALSTIGVLLSRFPDATVACDDAFLYVTSAEVQYRTRVLAAEAFPAWQQLIPSRDGTQESVFVDAAVFRKAMASLVPIAAGQPARLSVADGVMTMSLVNPGGVSAEQTIHVEGPTLDMVALNPVLVRKSLAGLTGRIELTSFGQLKPVLFTGDNVTAIVMPVRVPCG